MDTTITSHFLRASLSLRTLCVLLAVSVSTLPATAAVVISEIMYNPDGSDTEVGASKEWVELYNNGATAVDLSGWTLGDLQDGVYSNPFPNGTWLQPNQALVVSGDIATFDAQWNMGPQSVPRIEVENVPSLANSPSPTNETVGLLTATGAVADRVNFDDEAAWPSDSPDGASIMLKPTALTPASNDNGANWLPSMAGVYGANYTPGPGSLADRASPGFVEQIPQSAFAPSPDAAWSMVVLPDTQAYSKSSVDRAHFTQMTQWIVDNQQQFGIEFVLHEGDIVNQNSQLEPTSGDQSGNQQWQNAKAAMSLLDGVVPYAFSPGNHDYGSTNAQDRSTQFNDFFTQSDNPLVDPLHSGTLKSVMTPGELDNTLHEFTAPDGRKMLIVTTEWGPRQQAVDWASRAVRQPEFADHTAVLLTHAYMYNDETRLDWQRNLDSDPTNNQGGNPHAYPTSDDTHDGEQLWQELVSPNQAFEMVLSGHIGGDGAGYLASRGTQDQTVHQMLFDTQFESNGGNGWLRVLEFLDDGRTVRVRTYSPLHELQKTNHANSFEFVISPLRPGDYNSDGRVDVADYTLWREQLGSVVPAWSASDGNGDGLVGPADYEVWQASFSPETFELDLLAVPEPATAAIAIVLATLVTRVTPQGKPTRTRR